MKKLKIFSAALLLVSVGAFVAFRIWQSANRDDTPPVITCESEEIEVSISASREEMLAGVTAWDEESGDVTDTLLVESLSDFTEDQKRVITYAALDDSKNVSRCERTLVYTDYQPPVFDMNGPLIFTTGQKVNILGKMSAESPLDGNLTNNIKYSLEKAISTGVPGNYPVEFRVMDSAGKVIYLDTQIEIYDASYMGIQIELSDYLVYIKKGDSFDPEDYYVGADEEGKLSIKSKVDTDTAGCYYVDYTVKGTYATGKSRLVVVVQ